MDAQTLKFAARLLTSRVSGKGRPFLVQLNVTNRCNYRCAYCYASYYQRSPDELSTSQVKDIVHGLRQAGMFRLNLVGGEPLLRKDVGEIIDYARSLDVHCALTSNGSLMPQRIEAIRNLNVACLSIDGRPVNNDQNRGRGAYERTFAGLVACAKRGIPVQLSAVITRHTFGDVDFMVELAERQRCRVGFSVLIGSRAPGGAPEEDLRPSDAQVRSALGRILEHKQAGRPVLFSADSYRHALRWPDYSREVAAGPVPEGRSRLRCFAGRFYCLVDFNGDVYPCPQLIGRVKPGNVLRDGLAAALEKAGRHGCQGCAIPCSTDFNLFFGLKPAVLFDHFTSYGKR